MRASLCRTVDHGRQRHQQRTDRTAHGSSGPWCGRSGRGQAWLDTGTFASLVEAGEFVRVLETRQRLKIGSPEDVAFEKGFITAAQLRDLAAPLLKSGYGNVLHERAERALEGEGDLTYE